MGNKLDKIRDKTSGMAIIMPEMWLKHILIENYDQYKGYFKRLPAEMQTEIIQLVKEANIFNIKSAAREWYYQNKGRHAMIVEAVKNILESVNIEENNKSLK